MTSPYQHEREMYEPVRKWLDRFLRDRFKDAQIRVYDGPPTKLLNILRRSGPEKTLPSDWPTWDIQVDVVGFIQMPDVTHLALVECKNTALTIAHLAQLLGYARIARPRFAFLIAPQGMTGALTQLLRIYHRFDVLEYIQQDKSPRALILARWDANSRSIDRTSVITTDFQKVQLDRYS